MTDYVELRCRSAFSFLSGASLPEDLVAHAATLEYDTLTLADRNGVYGAPRFFQAARQAGIRPLVGAEVTVTGVGNLWLLVESRAGYRNLCRLLTAAALGREKGNAEASWEQVEEHAAGLHCLAGGVEGPLAPGSTNGATAATPGRWESTTAGVPTRSLPQSAASRASVVASRSGAGPGG